MKPRFWPLLTAGFGVLTLAALFAIGQAPEVRAAFPDGDFALALNAFQRVETPEDLTRVFGAPADPAVVAAMHAGNTLDLWAFIPAYTLFLLSAAAMIAGGMRTKLFWISALPTLIGALGDVIETSAQLRMTADIANAESLLPIAPMFWLKYFGLALGGVGASTICLLHDNKRFILAALGVTPLVATFALFMQVGAPPLMTAAFGAFWVGLLLLAMWEVVRSLKPNKAIASA